MSECVVRMEMPKACTWVDNGILKRCPLLAVGGSCSIAKRIDYQDNSRPSWCPIVCSLPEGHGRLIDWDAFEGIGFKLCRKTNGWKAELGTPTDKSYVVPAERSET
jgi:hypothetical protein